MKSLRAQLFLALFLGHIPLWAQVGYEALNYGMRSQNEWQRISQSDSTRQSSFHPNISADVHGGRAAYNSFIPRNVKDSAFVVNRKYKERSWFHRKLLKEHFIIVDTGKLYLTIDPLFNVSAGGGQFEYLEANDVFARETSTIYTNTRGLLLKGDIGRKLSFESYFYENQSDFPRYVSEFIDEFGVVPGQGRPKDFKEGGFDYAQSGGYVSYAPWKTFNLQAGHHKHFIGDGYRSLFLSDNGFNYPFLRMNSWFMENRLSYSFMLASHQNLNRLPTPANSESPFERKGGSYHFLQFQATDWLRLNLFQGMIWRTMDSTGGNEMDYNMLNPVMFVNPAIYGMDDENNAVLGMGMRLDPLQNGSIYGQFLIDDNDLKKTAFQVGAFYFPLKNLRLQLELNHAEPGTYTYIADVGQSYTHYNEGHHPLGTGFSELIFRINYRWQRLLASFSFMNSRYADVGNRLFEGENGLLDVPGQGSYYPRRNPADRRVLNAEIAFLINPATNAKLFLSWTHRRAFEEVFPGQTSTQLENNFIYFGVRTDLRNLYYDF